MRDGECAGVAPSASTNADETDAMRIGGAVVNRTQQLVLGFVVLAWLALMVILLVSPEIYDRSLRAGGSQRRLVDLGFVVVLTGLLALLGLAVVRRWRWAFWLILIAFFAGLLRVPAAALELTRHLSTGAALPDPGHRLAPHPRWYVVLSSAARLIRLLRAAGIFVRSWRSGVD